MLTLLEENLEIRVLYYVLLVSWTIVWFNVVSKVEGTKLEKRETTVNSTVIKKFHIYYEQT